MSAPDQPSDPFAAPGYGPPPPQGQAQPPYASSPYGAPPPGYGYPVPGGYSQQPAYPQQPGFGYGPGYGGAPYVGRIQPTGITVLLTVVTLGIWSYVWTYRAHEDMKRHSGQGLGGGVALVLLLFVGVAIPFVSPSEVGGLYERRGQQKPLSGVTGLWYFGGFLLGLVPLIIGLVIGLSGNTITTDLIDGTTRTEIIDGGKLALGLSIGIGGFVLLGVGGALVWFAKTNGALNAYWRSLGAIG